MRYTQRLGDVGFEPSVGSRGASYDNAVAEPIIGLFDTEVLWPRRPWHRLEEVELAALEWVACYNTQRRLEQLRIRPPAEYEEGYDTSYTPQLLPLELKWRRLRRTRGSSQGSGLSLETDRLPRCGEQLLPHPQLDPPLRRLAAGHTRSEIVEDVGLAETTGRPFSQLRVGQLRVKRI